MDRLRITIGLVFASALWAAGCTTSPWPEDAASGPLPSGTPQSAAYPATSTPDAPTLTPAGPSSAHDPQALQEVIAEVHRLRAVDPAAEAELLESLRQTPPDLWPMVVEQFRAVLAFRSRAAKPHAPAEPTAAAAQTLVAKPATPSGEPVAAEPYPSTDPASPDATPTAKLASAAPDAAPAVDTAVQTVSHTTTDPPSDDWQRHLDDAVRRLESQVSPTPEDADQIAQHARLRMLYLLAGRRDDAMKPIPAVAAGTQDFWSNELYGLAALLDGTSSASPSRLAAEAQRPLDQAVARLSESCPLVLSNLAFVTEVQSFGVFERFDKDEFAPGQKLLLYAEVENFKSTESAKGFHTALKSSYQIFDPGGRRVADHEFAPNEEHCRNRRRDFFIGYEFRLPERIYPGRHVLKLTVEDVNSVKVGQSSIEFVVKEL